MGGVQACSHRRHGFVGAVYGYMAAGPYVSSGDPAIGFEFGLGVFLAALAMEAVAGLPVAAGVKLLWYRRKVWPRKTQAERCLVASPPPDS